MMRRLSCFWAAMLFAQLAQASDTSAALLAGVKARLDEPSLLRGRFVQQKTVAGFRKPLVSSGDFSIWRGHGLLWHTQKPFDSTLALRRDRLSVTQADGRGGYRLDGEREPGLRAVNGLVFALFSGDIAVLQKHFRPEGGRLGEKDWALELVPADTVLVRVFKRIELAGDRHVREVRLEEANGDLSVIRFEQLTEAAAAGPDEARSLGD